MLDGNTNMLSPKFAFVYLGHVLTLGRKKTQNSRYDKATQAHTGRQIYELSQSTGMKLSKQTLITLAPSRHHLNSWSKLVGSSAID